MTALEEVLASLDSSTLPILQMLALDRLMRSLDRCEVEVDASDAIGKHLREDTADAGAPVATQESESVSCERCAPALDKVAPAEAKRTDDRVDGRGTARERQW